MSRTIRHLVLVLGDQLDRHASAWDGFDPALDAAWMCEAADESTHVWSTKPRIAVFLPAMRHFAADLQRDGIPLDYRQMNDGTLADALSATFAERPPDRVVLTEPGEFRVREAIVSVCAAAGVPLEIREDRHFYCRSEDFRTYAKAHRALRMEFFYREMRIAQGVLMDPADSAEPAGGRWNFDTENRRSFGVKGPGLLVPPKRFPPDAITREVIALVESRFADHPGRLDRFDWPVTRVDALAALEDFVRHRLADFGTFQDAMWSGEPWLHHAQISSSLNLKLLDPREAVEKADAAFRSGAAPLAAVEGFVRQILGWREYVRGVYWLEMPDYLESNALDAHENLPAWYWTGETAMRCLAQAIGQTLEHGYAHHIQRLMVTGLYAMLLGVEPKQIHGWYLAVYVDAVEWVELPNVLGMSQFADGGRMGSKPYAASGRYIDRMSDYCRGCRYDPAQRTGESACPFTTLYWDFLDRHEKRFAAHPRMRQQVMNLRRFGDEERLAIHERARAVREDASGAP